MNVLLVAPSSDLDYADVEVQAVANALHPTMLIGRNATSAALLDALAEPFDLIWFAMHGSREGIELADGLLSSQSLIQFLRDQPRVTLFLNTCSSLLVAMDIHDDLDTPIICTIVDVADREAYHTGALLARHLSAGKSLQDAYHLVRPGRNRQFLFLNGNVSGNTDRMDDLLIAIRESTKALHGRIDAVERRISGVERDMNERLDLLALDLRSNYQLRLRRGNSIKWGLGYALFTVSVWLFYYDVRSSLGMNFLVAGILAMVMLPTAGYLFMTGMGFSFDPERSKNA